MNWRAVIGYEGLYEVSDMGVVRGKERIITDKNGVKRCCKEKVIAAQLNSRGYLAVNLSRDGKRQTFMMHRIVAAAYIVNNENLPQVNHLDGNKTNNNVDNLEWASISRNVQHAYDIGLNPQCGCTHRLAVAIIDTVTGEIYCTQKKLADHFEVSYGNLKNALKGLRPFPKGIDIEAHSFQKYSC